MMSPRRKRERRALDLHGVHSMAMRRQLAWAREFAHAGDLASALDALSDAGALAQELGRRVGPAGLAEL
jgi:hypothetical protein